MQTVPKNEFKDEDKDKDMEMDKNKDQDKDMLCPASWCRQGRVVLVWLPGVVHGWEGSFVSSCLSPSLCR